MTWARLRALWVDLQHVTPSGARDSRDARATFVIRGVLVGLFVLVSIYVDSLLVVHYTLVPSHLFSDAELYWRATSAWLAGADPWQAQVEGITFAGIPPTLLINLPLQPFGVEVARPFWAVASLAGWLFAIWRFRMPLWWLPFPPFWEAWLAGSPDPLLLGMVAAGAGAFAAATKPYSIPGLIARSRSTAVVCGALLVVATIPLLPWGQFIADFASIRATLAAQAANSSTWGNWPLMMAAGAALASLGWRRALAMSVPVLAPSAQHHYTLFSVEEVKSDPGLGLALALPAGAGPGIIIYAVVVWAYRIAAYRWRNASGRASLSRTSISPTDFGPGR